MQLIVGGIDPSLRNTGLAKGYFDIETEELDIFGLHLLETEKETGRQVRANSDLLRRANVMAGGVHMWLKDCAVAFAEIPSGAQSAAAAQALGIAVGVLGTVGMVGDFKGKLVQVMPSEVKKLFVGSKVASKDEMIEEAVRRWPNAGWKKRRLKGEMVLLKDNEHLADACAAINAGILTDQFKSLVQILRSIPSS